MLLVVFGALFAGARILGLVRGSTEPCGCFGAGSSRPLGVSNVLMGAAVLATGAWALRTPGADTAQEAVALLAVACTAGSLLYSHRRHAYTVAGNLLKQSESAV
ncbi:hypothetical protein [Streptomyces acidiscabies]|uniref:Methylamine utilization protein MauE n=1 Tax=Streptomyces acidiscabies TaxID=42234 RepID=A0AAP6ELA3_9ACTN|nr:hypothetical protein [Streptomyces acidiscabies]MBZ3909333.1 hypothetical protein [Streptomyces acidiscabies]MDX2966843.1 hypothetical protein [Streptomyces acidiscabies]MDX3019976.1 hypothetical protein [Streptomyces acidiscabies]MDX3796716.1 hypothetical protein [Streptomyces acidiscabies]GAQ55218.1 hypothetical protein a10_05040 [Streptomyces acidiscabies]